MSKIQLSVIIVTYKNLNIIVDCLNSINLYNDIEEKLEVIVIDNSPQDDIFHHIKDNFKWVKIFRNENKGFGQGNNVGAQYANGEYLLFLNPDTILIESIFQFAIEKFENNSKITLFGVKLLDANLKGNMSYYFIDKYSFFYGQITRLFNKINLFFPNLMYISGANLFVRRNIFIQIGMFDESIFMYYEEPDVIKRIKLRGGEIGFYKEKKIIHLEGKTVINNELALRRRLESAKYYSEKYSLRYNLQIKHELHYNRIKYLIYKIIKNDRQADTLKAIEILYEYGEKYDNR